MFEEFIPIIEKCPLFYGIASEGIQSMLTCLKPTLTHYGKQAIVAQANSAFDGIGIVLAGSLTVVKENIAGNRMMMAQLTTGDLFGEMAAFSGRPVWPATVYAEQPSTVLFLPPQKLIGTCEKTCLSHETVTLNLLRIISQKALMLNRKVEYLTLKSVRAKIATFLFEHAQKADNMTFFITMNRNEMADFLNIARPALSRELGRMQDEGLIAYHQASFRILDKERLKLALE